jgi:hypothetical protein
MIVTDTNLFMTAESRLEKTDSRTETLKTWVDPPQVTSSGDTVTLTPEALWASSLSPKEMIENDPKLLIIKKLIEAVTGHSIRTLTAQDLAQAARGNPDISGQARDASPEGPERAGWGMRYDYAQTHAETETSTFQATGIIKTADGKEIQFSLAVRMARSFASRTSGSLRAGDALIDPLVVNFDGPAAVLTDQKFSFDLNADGRDESIPFFGGGSGSGLLALDANGDGKINDGGELFGPTTGNGFAELSTFDGDRNGWIEEKDTAYERLSIWTKAADGTDVLTGLKASGVGAIFAGYADTAFALTDDANELRGQVRRTGLYLSESGKAGSVQQVDIAV